jgi:hypothetical protein
VKPGPARSSNDAWPATKQLHLAYCGHELDYITVPATGGPGAAVRYRTVSREGGRGGR